MHNAKPFLFATLLSGLMSMFGTQASAQADAWTEYMLDRALFSAHSNDCSQYGSMYFIPLFDGGSTGFCIEKTERAAESWDKARQICLAKGYRLPEPAEFKAACLKYSSSSTTWTNNPEWASNFATPMYAGSTSSSGVFAPTMGGSTCSTGGLERIATNSSEAKLYFRCVR